MAARRMFAKTIIDSDAFIDMPLSTQALYFHLSMRADDEGFINNPRKIQRMIGASDDDLKVLIAKKFIIPFESGIVVIKHWKIHNYIRADRIVETKYTEERALLDIKDNGAYSISESIKEINNMDEQDIRKIAYKNSTLPYSFTYKIRRAFEGKTCPVCNKTMRGCYKTSMPTVQHNIPLSKGGVHEIENISVICESCNTSIRDEETSSLNNEYVVEMWDKIVYADSHNINWFKNPGMLDEIGNYDTSVICQQSDGQMSAQYRLGKVSIGNNNISCSKKSGFSIPTVDEIKAYCDSVGSKVDAEAFWAFYDSKGWMVGRNKMKSWKSAIVTWEKSKGLKRTPPKKTPKQEKPVVTEEQSSSEWWDSLDGEIV